jgi:hypothetical protein
LSRILFILAFISVLALQPLHAQDVAVEVSEAQISAVITRCFTRRDCETAVADLVAELSTSNRGTTASAVIGSIAVVLAERSNAAIGSEAGFNVAAHAATLEALAGVARRNAMDPLARTLAALALNVAERLSIDLGAIASGQAIKVIDAEASPA